jgi:SLOG in TRPM, prokaryote
MHEPLIWTLTNGSTARAILADDSIPLANALSQIALKPPSPTLTVIGGASKIDDGDLKQLHALFFTVLAPLAQALQAVIIDGGTNSGVMQLMGQAHMSIGGTFPLVGVIPAGKIIMQDATPNIGKLETHHTHFVLTPGKQWGDESPWLARVATVLAGSKPSLTLLANGGDIAWRDVASSIEQGRPVVIIAGSGRTADMLAEAVWGRTKNERARELAASGLLRVLDINSSREVLTQSLLRMFKDT